jgi:hypothetical protein
MNKPWSFELNVCQLSQMTYTPIQQVAGTWDDPDGTQHDTRDDNEHLLGGPQARHNQASNLGAGHLMDLQGGTPRDFHDVHLGKDVLK